MYVGCVIQTLSILSYHRCGQTVQLAIHIVQTCNNLPPVTFQSSNIECEKINHLYEIQNKIMVMFGNSVLEAFRSDKRQTVRFLILFGNKAARVTAPTYCSLMKRLLNKHLLNCSFILFINYPCTLKSNVHKSN